MLMSIGAQAYRIRDMIGDTMLFARPPKPELSDVRLSEVISTVVRKQATELADERCRVKITCDDGIILRADAVQLSIVLSELLRNSREALRPGGGEIEISANADSSHATLHVVDHGKGFTPEELTHAFDPFFSGRQAGRGLGFGLPKCWRIIQQHQGQIEIASSHSGPTTVQVTWPLAQA
jgi:signal transduction histidine kinase